MDTDDYHQLNFSDSHWCSIERRATTTKAVPEFIQKEMEKFIRVDDSVMREKLLKGVPQDSLERQNNNESSLSGSIYLGAYSNRIGPIVTRVIAILNDSSGGVTAVICGTFDTNSRSIVICDSILYR